ncbi:uncharacterized protein E0L32_007912 [Thyridium curvatum]|uniref:Serine hydrolase domain-containing protein n=1 Tax=Thyridium curvatum TaxID=1093900 RepID=A0A507B1W1_9PEZI|nr:uncharacterized protein E0L32_007912 [Thyridium curvatum]TPX11051.1 hypothetical protein E0L32_007912 [Thyridium curvatum]
MATQSAAASGGKAGQKPGKREIKILMLHGEEIFPASLSQEDESQCRYTPSDRALTSHPLPRLTHSLIYPHPHAHHRQLTHPLSPGYTQSGPLFRAKTRALDKLIQKALAPANLTATLVYPTAPNRLRPQDIPGYQPPEGDDAGQPGDGDDDDEYDSWAWFRRDDATGTYRLLPEGMRRIAQAIRDDCGGRADGVVGFSQGGAVAAMLAAALEPDRAVPPPPAGSDAAAEDGPAAWADELRAANGGRPLRFAVSYSGFWAPPAELAWLYEPPVATPTLHVLGGLDTVVDESRSRALVDRCEDPVVVVHPGGHYVPVSREWAMPLIGFIHKHAKDDEAQRAQI